MTIEVKDFGLSATGGVNATTGFFPEGQLPSTVNDGMRTVMAAVRRVTGDLSGEYTATFTAQVYTLPSNQEVTSLARGHCFTWIAEAANTGTATLVVSGLAAVPIKRGDAHLVANDIVTGQAVTTVYDGTSFQMLNPQSDRFHTTRFFAVAAADTPITNSGAFQRIALATEVLDVGGNFATSFYTVPTTGYYMIYAKVVCQVTPAIYSTLSAGIEAADSGGTSTSVVTAATEIMPGVAGAANYTAFGSYLVNIAAGKRIYLNAAQNSSDAATSAKSALCWMYGERIA